MVLNVSKQPRKHKQKSVKEYLYLFKVDLVIADYYIRKVVP